MSGTPRRHTVVADGGAGVFREFCGQCGTHLFSGGEAFPQFRTVKLVTLDNPAAISPIAHMWTENIIPWACIDDELPRFSKQISGLERLWDEMRDGVTPQAVLVAQESPGAGRSATHRVAPESPRKKLSFPLHGGCLCGATRFECRAEPITAVLCHCRTCQKFHAAPYAACAMMPQGSIVVVAGEPVRFDAIGDTGAVVFREFCGRCGTQLFSGSSAFSLSKTVKVAALDNPAAIPPVAHLHTENRIPWACISDGLPRYVKQVQELTDLERLWAEGGAGAAQQGAAADRQGPRSDPPR
jgi:hypothetical protein